MPTQRLDCPNCGGKIQVPNYATSASCGRCGAIIEDIPSEFFSGQTLSTREDLTYNYSESYPEPDPETEDPYDPPNPEFPAGPGPQAWEDPHARWNAPVPRRPRRPAVPLDIGEAGFLSRSIAFILDFLLLSIIMLFIILLGMNVSLEIGESSFFLLNIWFLGSMALISLGYFTFFEGMYQQTPGKMVLGIVVVDENVVPIGFGDALIRNLLRLIWFIPCLNFYIFCGDAYLVFDEGQRIGDRVAGTMVMDKKFIDSVKASQTELYRRRYN